MIPHSAIILALAIGAATIIQSGLNRRMAEHWGLFEVGLVNNALVLVFNLLLWWLAWRGFFQESIFLTKFDWKAFRWWVFIPALCGATIVLFFPYSIAKIGALSTVIIVVASQTFSGFLWDLVVEGRPFSWYKVGAAMLAFGAVLLSQLAPEQH